MKISFQTKKSSMLRKGFTLIEILVVIAIIAILASISYGPIIEFMEKGKEAEAKKVAKDFQIAITTFQEDYDGNLPYDGTYPDEDTNLTSNNVNFLAVLMGAESANDINEKEKPYFTGKNAQNKRNGFVLNGEVIQGFVDHWGNPYTMRLDYDADKEIDTALITSPTGVYTGKQRIGTAIVATPGKDNVFNDEKDIKSW